LYAFQVTLHAYTALCLQDSPWRRKEKRRRRGGWWDDESDDDYLYEGDDGSDRTHAMSEVGGCSLAVLQVVSSEIID
jgi:hypothetical protein